MKYYKCTTKRGNKVWISTYTWFDAAMVAFGAQETIYLKKTDDCVEYTGGWVEHRPITKEAEEAAASLFTGTRMKPRIIAIEVEGYAIDANDDLIHESDLDSEAHFDKVRYSIYLVFEKAGRENVADFVREEDARIAQDELETHFGTDAPPPPLENT